MYFIFFSFIKEMCIMHYFVFLCTNFSQESCYFLLYMLLFSFYIMLNLRNFKKIH